jgi:hypothetical protein
MLEVKTAERWRVGCLVGCWTVSGNAANDEGVCVKQQDTHNK